MGPKSYSRSKERIIEDINEALTKHPEVDATHIEVSCENGEVTLKGTVNERQEKRRAEEIAEEVSGVKEVRNELRVGSQQQQPQQGATGAPNKGSTNASGTQKGGGNQSPNAQASV